MIEVQAVNAGPARYDSREAPWSAGDGSAEPGAYRPGYELLAEQILRLIGELALAPGDRMPTEQNLAARLGASRTTVREAVKILSAIGRIRAQKGRGLYVADGRACSGRAFSSRCVADIGGIIEFMGIVTGPVRRGDGIAPAVALVDPKFPHNVGAAVRAASCYGVRQVWFSGDRVRLDGAKRQRLPREERMRGYKEVEVRHAD